MHLLLGQNQNLNLETIWHKYSRFEDKYIFKDSFVGSFTTWESMSEFLLFLNWVITGVRDARCLFLGSGLSVIPSSAPAALSSQAHHYSCNALSTP